jgi:hypothetical protein
MACIPGWMKTPPVSTLPSTLHWIVQHRKNEEINADKTKSGVIVSLINGY